MRRSFTPWVVVLLVLLWGSAWAQENANPASDNPVTVQPGPIPAFVYPDSTPSLDFLNEPLENSSITLGIGLGYTYYNNTYTTGQSNSRGLFNITPQIKIQQYRQHFSWHIAYAGGYQKYVQGGGNAGYNNLFSQDASAGFLWQMARHWQMLANDAFIYTADPFSSFIAIPGNPSVNNPNPVAYSSLTQYTLNTGFLTLTDQLTKTDTLSFTGNNQIRRTSSYNLTSVPFYNLVSYGGLAAYSHQLSPRLTLGGSYDFNSLDFGHGQQRSGIQTMSFTVNYLLRPNITISGWVGPQYTSTKTIVFDPLSGQSLTTYTSLWSSSEGANFSWQAQRNVFQAGFFRRVMDGGGLIATAQVTSVNATYRRMIAKKWNGNAGVTFLDNVSTTATARKYTNVYLDLGVDYKISKSFSASGRYAFQKINESNVFVVNNNYNDNRFGVTLTYNWTHPLGR